MNDYRVICYYSKEDQAYLAFAPDYPGCVADGETPEDANRELSVVLNMWLEVAEEDGVPLAIYRDETLETAAIEDIAHYILSRTGTISTMALQKLLYYSLAWSLAWYGKPLFDGRFQAWKDGPVNYGIFKIKQGSRTISSSDIRNYNEIDAVQKRIVDNVIEVYGREDGKWLSDLTHDEKPWKDARAGLPDGAPSDREIKNDVIEDYYKSLICGMS